MPKIAAVASRPSSRLANQIYVVLLRTLTPRRTRGANRSEPASPSITYGELAAALRAAQFPSMTPRNRVMHAALGEITAACHAAKLPCLPALVWRRDHARPGDAYYPLAHPAAKTDEARLTAWKREYDRVVAAVERYPKTLSST